MFAFDEPFALFLGPLSLGHVPAQTGHTVRLSVSVVEGTASSDHPTWFAVLSGVAKVNFIVSPVRDCIDDGLLQGAAVFRMNKIEERCFGFGKFTRPKA